MILYTSYNIFQKINWKHYNADSTPNSNKLWRFSDLAQFMEVSESKLRRDVLHRKIPCIRIGNVVRFDKQHICSTDRIRVS